MKKVVCASIDENRNVSGGKAGDQTGKEVHVVNFYDFGQTKVIRFKSRLRGKISARALAKLAKSKYVGYDQSERTSLFTELEKVKFNVNKLKTPCETDCSQFVIVGARCAGVKIANTNTSGLCSAALATKKFDILAYQRGMVLRSGDMIVAPGHHVVEIV